MPNYVYYCKCGYKEEVFQKIKDMNDPVHCGDCKKQMSRQVCAPAIPSIVGRYEFEKNNDWSKNELDKELKEHDKFRIAEDKDTEAAIKSGEFIQKMEDI